MENIFRCNVLTNNLDRNNDLSNQNLLINNEETIETKNENDSREIPVRLVFLGNVDSGKTTLVSVLSNDILDNGKGKARTNIFRHPHERACGRTSAIAMEFCKVNNRKSILIDLCGHERYLKTTLFGLNLTQPDYCFIVVAANMGVSKMTIEHITMSISLGYRLVICLTKIDISPEHITQNTLKVLNKLLVDKLNKKLKIINNYRIAKIKLDELDTLVNDFVPLVTISNVNGSGIGKLKYLINRLPNIRTYNSQGKTEFMVDDHFHLKGVGLVLSGSIIRGCLSVGDILELGTNKNNEFRSIEIKSLYYDDKPIKTLSAGHHCTIGIRLLKQKDKQNIKLTKKNYQNELCVRRGMVAVDPKAVEEGKTRYFTADIYILHHQTTITDNRTRHGGSGYQAIIHCNGVRQTAEIIKIYNDSGYIRCGDRIKADFRFCYHDEYLKIDDRFIFREGHSRGVGRIVSINNNNNNPNNNKN